MANELAVVNTAAMPSNLRTLVNKWSREIVEGGDPKGLVKLHATAVVDGVRATGEGVVIGSLLGAFHALNPTGLDIKVPGTKLKVPADALGAVIGLLGSVAGATAPHAMGKSSATAATVCAGIYGFRQTNDLISALKAKRAGATGGTNIKIGKADFGAEARTHAVNSLRHSQGGFNGEDPILRAAAGC